MAEELEERLASTPRENFRRGIPIPPGPSPGVGCAIHTRVVITSWYWRF